MSKRKITTLEALEQGYELIKTSYTKGTYHSSYEGMDHYCSLGALGMAVGQDPDAHEHDMDFERYARALSFGAPKKIQEHDLTGSDPFTKVIAVNDNTSKRTTLAMWRRAIEHQRDLRDQRKLRAQIRKANKEVAEEYKAKVRKSIPRNQNGGLRQTEAPKVTV